VIGILHIVGSASISGKTKHLAHLASALPRSEFDTHLVALDGPKNGSDPLFGTGIEPIVVGRHATIDPLALYRLRPALSG
jgi:hypothetical protein